APLPLRGLAFDTVLPDLAQFEKSVTYRIPITLHAKRSEEADIARQFFGEVERRLQGIPGSSRRSSTTHVRDAAVVAAFPTRLGSSPGRAPGSRYSALLLTMAVPVGNAGRVGRET